MQTTRLLLLVALIGFASASFTCKKGYCSTDSSPVDANRMMPLLLAVKQKNLDILEHEFWAVSDPKSDRYGQFLSHSQVGELTANPIATNKVVSFLKRHGASEVEAVAHGSFVRAKVPASTVETLFAAQYQMFTHVHTGHKLYRSLDHVIPEELQAHVDFVAHVSDFPAVRGPILSSPVKTNLRSSSNGDALVTPSQLWSTYSINQHSGSLGNMSVFEVTQDYAPSDLASFESTYNVPTQTIANVIGPNDPSQCTTNPNACGEASLDVQYIIGVANGVPLTYWSMSATDQTPFYDWIVDVAATAFPPLVHSMSYGEVENDYSTQTINRTEAEFLKMGVRGLTIVISSGDDGVGNFPARSSSSNCGFNPSWPASSPYVLAVGATQFKDGSTSAGEIPCQSDNSPASLITTGGGFSSLYAAPTYQQSAVDQYLATASLPPVTSNPQQFPSPGFNKAGRGYPDVAALGHNYEVVIGGQTVKVDGTSASAPVVAGMMALINSARLQSAKAPLGFVNPLLYSLYSSNPGIFNDVTSGNNKCTASTVCCSSGFNAQAGWDPLAGLGTINFDQLLAAAA